MSWVKIKAWKPKGKQYASRYGFYFLWIGAILFLIYENKKDGSLSTIAFSALTALFSYLAYRFSQEKFRLDLFDKRWEIYENTL